MRTYLDFEKPIAELESKVAELRALSDQDDSAVSIADELATLEEKSRTALIETYAKLTPWQKTQVARHPERPHFLDYIHGLVADFTPLAGDRLFAEDHAIIGGLGRMNGRSVMVIGHEKGSDTEGRIKHNFGMARPEGYRKAQRLMGLAERFSVPVVTLVDTAGAYPGIGAEERGQAEAIARSTDVCMGLGVPIVSLVIGEGGSGGAVAIATANRIYMLEHSIYTVASPEAAASILWRDSARAVDAATNMKITAQDLLGLGVIDGIISEPTGGAHRERDNVIAAAGAVLDEALSEFSGMSADEIRKDRREKFLAMGRVS
ncbi:acetyl-CoA carboxylase carboxyltransferase subunit alpha [Methyloligella sp. 2.7D]|uniref:acetyl-CoA carboxylase carboxyltransferase subunit alpha n=1 Tax=unclassified Methyloligella TaxID=2625955 RepID=UPI00157C5C4B|nr:acetyl-CoA carboxylase carboxyltransferase subunit alpha [Methyloligella sp. GL2]QKP76587.1 acetyl-CoA carboxylase carboxyltransferase subunit alpha [Methyloligella sp. GL2]